MIEKNNAFSSLSLFSLPSPLPKQRKKKILWLCVDPLRRPDWLWIPYQHSKGEKLYVPQLLRRRRREMLLRLRILLNSPAPSPPPPAPRGAIFPSFLCPPTPLREKPAGRSLWEPGPESLHASLTLPGQDSHARGVPWGCKALQADRAASFCITFNKYLFLHGEIVQIL